MSIRAVPSGAPVARVHAEILDEKPSSRVAFVFALSLHPRQTSQIVTCGTFILHAGCRNVLIKVGEREGDHFSLRAVLLRQLGAIFRARLLLRCTRRAILERLFVSTRRRF